MNTLLVGTPELDRQPGALPDHITAEPVGVIGVEVLGAHSDLIVESLGDAAITLANQAVDIGSETPMMDKRGNYLPVQLTDLREVARDRPWALEGPSVRRFVSLDVPMAIVKAYRMVPHEARSKVVQGHTSDIALTTLAAGYGANKGFWPYALSLSMRELFGFNPAQPGFWEHK